MLGAALLGQKRYAEAEPLLVSGYEGLKERENKLPASKRGNYLSSVTSLVQLYTDWGKPEQAALWQQKLDELKKSGPKPQPAPVPPASAK